MIHLKRLPPRLPAALDARGGPGVPDEKECFFREARSVTVQPWYVLALIQCGRPEIAAATMQPSSSGSG